MLNHNISDNCPYSISVIIPVYKNLDNLSKTLSSIYSQDCIIKEVIISDDCPECTFSKEIIDTLFIPCDKCNVKDIIWLNNSIRRGTVKHLNYLASIAKGDYIKFLPPGDTFAHTSSLRQLAFFIIDGGYNIATSICKIKSDKNSELLYPSSGYIKKLTGNDAFRCLAVHNMISSVGTIFKADFFLNGGFCEDYFLLEDWPTWLRYIKENGNIPLFSAVTVLYELSGVSSSLGNAYLSPILKKDMIMCYENEILPFIHIFSFSQGREILFKYHLLCNKKNIWLFMKYPLQLLKFKLKKIIKKIIT